ncbi:MAG: hypothetical protein JSV32_08305 [Dehalococcoidia bacterium]|nr:MAG: hypothetical protein JSV32_08305 [Dehalococcoidia bacterium]
MIYKSILGKLSYPLFIMAAITITCVPLLSSCGSEPPVPQYTLTINIDGNGTSAGADTYDENTVVSISASPDEGWEFLEWSGDIDTLGERLSSSTTIVMDGDYTITARFRLQVVIPTSISNVVFNPTMPATLSYGEQVTFEFDYYIEERFPVNITPRPLSNGILAPGYLASGSNQYDLFKGRGEGSFTINSQSGQVVVDQIRFQIANVYQNIILYEFFIPVNFTFQ